MHRGRDDEHLGSSINHSVDAALALRTETNGERSISVGERQDHAARIGDTKRAIINIRNPPNDLPFEKPIDKLHDRSIRLVATWLDKLETCTFVDQLLRRSALQEHALDSARLPNERVRSQARRTWHEKARDPRRNREPRIVAYSSQNDTSARRYSTDLDRLIVLPCSHTGTCDRFEWRAIARTYVLGGAVLDARDHVARRFGLCGWQLAIDRLALMKAGSSSRDLDHTRRRSGISASVSSYTDELQTKLFDLIGPK
jgi:hypothetical protein